MSLKTWFIQGRKNKRGHWWYKKKYWKSLCLGFFKDDFVYIVLTHHSKS